MRFFVMMAIDNVTSNEAVVKMETIFFYMMGQFV